MTNITLLDKNLLDNLRKYLSDDQIKAAMELTEKKRDEYIRFKAAKSAANWIINKVLKIQNETGLSFDNKNPAISAKALAELLVLVDFKKLTHYNANIVFDALAKNPDKTLMPSKYIEEHDLWQESIPWNHIECLDILIKDNPNLVQDYKNGKKNVLDVFVGKIMKLSKGKANPVLIKQDLIEKLI